MSTTIAEIHDQLAAKIKDAYYAARDNGGTMHTAADDAAEALMPILADIWDDGFVSGSRWAPSTASGIPIDPPANPYHTEDPS